MRKENPHLAGKFRTRWEKSGMTRTNVIFLIYLEGNPCQVADVAFNHKAFEIVEA
jgi:hypothetical protein